MRESAEIEKLGPELAQRISRELIQKAELFPALSYDKIIDAVADNFDFIEMEFGVCATLPGFWRITAEILEVFNDE